jgi:small subunit ribosomal protein S9
MGTDGQDMSQSKYFYGVGRRKASTARAKYYPGDTELEVMVNKKSINQYFQDLYRQIISEAINTIGIRTGRIEFFINGGGIKGQAEAGRLALAKALLVQDEGFRPILRIHKYLTTDNRKVQSKRPGLRKARKREQWSKR